MDNINDKDIETLRLVTEIRETATKLRELSIQWQEHTGCRWEVRNSSYEGACCMIINDMERIFIKKFGLPKSEIYPEYDNPVEMLEVGKSYWAWVTHYEGASSWDIEVVAREGKKIYAKFGGAYQGDIIAIGEVSVHEGVLKDGRKVTYEAAYFTWETDRGYQYRGDISGWDKVED